MEQMRKEMQKRFAEDNHTDIQLGSITDSALQRSQ